MQLVKDYEIIAIEDIRKIEEKMNFKFQRQDTPFENTQHGITQLQNGFFNLLRDFILILPDASIQEVFIMCCLFAWLEMATFFRYENN